MPVARASREGGARRGLVQRLDLLAVDADPAADLHHPLVQQRRAA